MLQRQIAVGQTLVLGDPAVLGAIAVPVLVLTGSETKPLFTTSRGFALAKSRSAFATATVSPCTKAIAEGPASSSSNDEMPASLAAILVSVFFTTA